MSPLRLSVVSVSATAGGAEAHTVALGRGLSRRGHEVRLYGRCPGWTEQGLPATEVALGPKWSRSTMALGVARVPLERRQVADIPAPSVFYAQFKREQTALTTPLSRKAPVVWTEHGRWMGGAVGGLLLRWYGAAAQRVARVVCVSGAVADDVRRVVAPEKVVVIPNAIDTSAFAASAQQREDARRRLLPPEFLDRTVAVLASRLHPAKRHDRAVAAVLATGTPLVVVGDGPDRARLEALARGSTDVMFVGHQDDVRDWLRAADVYLYCGAETDGAPTAVLEAAASRLGIIGFHGDPGTDLVSKCGGIVAAGPRELTADLIAAAAANAGDGAAYVQSHHSREAWLDAYEAVFRECAA